MALFSFELGNKAGWIAAALVAAVLGAGCWWLHGDAVKARESAAKMETTAQAAQKALNEAVEARQKLETALTEHRARVQEMESQSAELRAKLKEAASHDQTVRDWSGTALPAAVRSLLQSR